MRPFFEYARERQSILLRRREGLPRPEWTDDPILSQYRFCNVYREDDITTKHFRVQIRDRLRNSPDVLLATVLWRWFNRTTTGDAIFSQVADHRGSGRGITAWEDYLEHGETDIIRAAVLTHCGAGPYVTGSYIIKTPNGMNKLDGVLWCVDQFNWGITKTSGGHSTGSGRGLGWEMLNSARQGHPWSLEDAWRTMTQHQFLGDFMSYEIVTDLRHTALLDRAPDIRTWANPGPGAMRGLNRLHGRDLNRSQPKHVFVCEMRALLELADGEYRHIWPHREGHQVEMRDIEHTLCEFDKYERARLGQGRPRGVYR
jgi:hypothetical protein